MNLIDKNALVVEIERRIKKRDIQMKSGCWVSSTYMYEDLLDFLNALEVKEVDLEKEVDIEDAVHGTVDYPIIGCDFPNIYPNYKELKEYCDRKGIKDNDKVKLIIIKDVGYDTD